MNINPLITFVISSLFLCAWLGRDQQNPIPDSTNRTAIVNQVEKQKKIEILPRTSWNAAPARPFKKHQPQRITIHHEGGRVLLPTDDARVRLKNIQTWCMGADRGWADIPYHFLIAPDGKVYQGRDPLTVGETNTDYDPTGHLLISFLGNYNEQKLDEHLLNTLTQLIAQFCQEYNISPETIATHQDHCEHTNCPGEHIYAYFENGEIKNKVKELLGK